VERPGSFLHGDYSTNVALVNKLDAHELASKLQIEGIAEIKVVGKFINFFLSRDAIVGEVKDAATKKEWGSNSLYEGKKIMVEYTDPNPFKEFHIGHLMSNAIGESIARVLESAGAQVMRANYQGDVGLHVAKAIWGLKQMANDTISEGKLGMAYFIGSEAYEEHKEEINAINKKIYEQSDAEINALYTEGRKISLIHFENIYKILGTKFDTYFFESETTPLGVASVKQNPTVFEESDSALVYRGEKDGLHTRVFLTSKGLPTYEAKDLGLLEQKSKIDLDLSITVTASEQNEYFKVVLAAAKHISGLVGIAEKTTHVSHGMMRFADSKMSSRKGNIITGESLLAGLIIGAHKKMQDRDLSDANKVAEQVAVAAIKYTVLKQGSGKDIVFDQEKSLSLEGDSGPYLQYSLVRARSVIKKVRPESVMSAIEEKDYWMKLARTLIHYPDVLARAAREMEPHYVTTYLTELAASFNSWYGAEQFIVDGKILGSYFLLVQAFEKTMSSGLTVLGIPTPEEM